MKSLFRCRHLDNNEILDVELRGLVFKILSQKKSFYVRGRTQEKSDQWIAALQSACRLISLLSNAFINSTYSLFASTCKFQY